MREILEKLRDGEVSIEEAERLLRLNAVEEIEDAALDIQRESRIGVPEIILGEKKTPAQLVEIVSTFLAGEGRAIVTRASEGQIYAVEEALSDKCDLRVDKKASIIVARRQGIGRPSIGRKVGLMTGGTADVVVAEEARTVAEEMGCKVITAYDVGIAGFHRHIEPLKRMLQEGVDTIVVVAGMEGALPSVIASLVDVPVIGVPTSVGYGFGAGGVGALTTMLQSCSPGLCVVNIDNGVGAGALAALIARQVAKACPEQSRRAPGKEDGG
ncbi:MAG: nickel pincer cofactor biosynthesis protein LarB [Chloroflexi bacterium]|nr:nickel pincer cofactor biosynthesis protein LarB [Chloroflexota bacterium]